MHAKTESPGYTAYVEKYDTTDAWELEAMDPGDLAQTLTKAIDSVIDVDAYNMELRAEKVDSAKIVAVQEQAKRLFQSLNSTEEN